MMSYELTAMCVFTQTKTRLSDLFDATDANPFHFPVVSGGAERD